MHPNAPPRSPEVLTLWQVLQRADIPTNIHAGNWQSTYPGATQLRYFGISQCIAPSLHRDNDTYILLGSVLLPAPMWDETVVMEHLSGGWEMANFMVQGF